MSHNQFSQFLNVAVCQSKCRLSRSYIQCHTTKADLILVALSGCFHLWVSCARRILLNRIWIPPRGVPCCDTFWFMCACSKSVLATNTDAPAQCNDRACDVAAWWRPWTTFFKEKSPEFLGLKMHQSFNLVKKETSKSEYCDKSSSQKLFSSWMVRIFGKISPKFSYSQNSGFEICLYWGFKKFFFTFLTFISIINPQYCLAKCLSKILHSF